MSFLIPPLLRDVGSCWSTDPSSGTDKCPRLCKMALTRIILAALAAFAVFKFGLSPILLFTGCALASYPAAFLFSAVVLTKYAFLATKAAFITHGMLAIPGLFSPIILYSFKAKVITAIVSTLLAGYTYLKANESSSGGGLLERWLNGYWIQ